MTNQQAGRRASSNRVPAKEHDQHQPQGSPKTRTGLRADSATRSQRRMDASLVSAAACAATEVADWLNSFSGHIFVLAIYLGVMGQFCFKFNPYLVVLVVIDLSFCAMVSPFSISWFWGVNLLNPFLSGSNPNVLRQNISAKNTTKITNFPISFPLYHAETRA
jgi:hypothetical protein